jgi:DNA-binding Lrp family transcriptional regulator
LSKKVMDSYIEKIHELLLDEDPRIPFRHIGRILKIYSKTASRLYRRALIEKILFPPMLRPRICIDYTEYVYLIKGENIQYLFERLKKDHRVEYVTWCQGHFDLLLIANERIDLTVEKEFKSIVLSGKRGDYFYPNFRPRNLYTVLEEINTFLDKKSFQPSELSSETLERGTEWGEREEKLFRYLKNNVRRTFIEIQRELDISRTLLLKLYSQIKKYTILTQPYYPKGYDSYVGYYLVMETENENQLVHLLGMLPSHSAFFKVKGSIVGYVNIEKSLSHEILHLMTKMETTGFVSSIKFALPIYYWTDGGISPG